MKKAGMAALRFLSAISKEDDIDVFEEIEND